LKAGAVFAKFRRALVNMHIEAALSQRDGGAKTAHAGADDCDPWFARHPAILPE
jgi:hypothetical protein